MRHITHCVTAAVLLFVLTVHGVAAQTPSHVWKNFVERIDLGTELNIRLSDGRRMRATLIGVREDAVLLQPKTRVPVSVQAVPYDAIVQMEPRKGGHSAGKAVAIGIATGVGVFFGIMALLVAAVGD
jgi:hypothetical protein